MYSEHLSSGEKAARLAEILSTIKEKFGPEAAQLARLLVSSFAKSPPNPFPTIEVLKRHIKAGRLRFDIPTDTTRQRATFVYRVPGEESDRRLIVDPIDMEHWDEFVVALVHLAHESHVLFGNEKSQQLTNFRIANGIDGVMLAIEKDLT